MQLPLTNTEISTVATLGLSGTDGSVGYALAEVANHFHSPMQIFGLTANTMARKAVTPIVITGGSDAWGTELEIHNGTVIEGGSSTKQFDLSKILVTAVGTANRVTMIEMYNNALGTASSSVTLTDAGDLFTLAGHGLSNGFKIMLSSIVSTTGINIYTVYYVVGVSGNNFQVALTLGGAAVAITTNGTCVFKVVTATLIAETMVSRIATAADGYSQEIQMDRQPCNSRISCRAYSAGGTNAVSFFATLHTYLA